MRGGRRGRFGYRRFGADVPPAWRGFPDRPKLPLRVQRSQVPRCPRPAAHLCSQHAAPCRCHMCSADATPSVARSLPGSLPGFAHPVLRRETGGLKETVGQREYERSTAGRTDPGRIPDGRAAGRTAAEQRSVSSSFTRLEARRARRPAVLRGSPPDSVWLVGTVPTYRGAHPAPASLHRLHRVLHLGPRRASGARSSGPQCGTRCTAVRPCPPAPRGRGRGLVGRPLRRCLALPRAVRPGIDQEPPPAAETVS